MKTCCIQIRSRLIQCEAPIQAAVEGRGERTAAVADNGCRLADRRLCAGGKVCQSRLRPHFLLSSNPSSLSHRGRSRDRKPGLSELHCLFVKSQTTQMRCTMRFLCGIYTQYYVCPCQEFVKSDH